MPLRDEKGMCILTAERKKMLSRPRLTERAISAQAHRICYLGRGLQNVLSWPRLTECAISAGAHRICYLGRGSQNVLSQTRFFSSNFVVVCKCVVVYLYLPILYSCKKMLTTQCLLAPSSLPPRSLLAPPRFLLAPSSLPPRSSSPPFSRLLTFSSAPSSK